jgi:hypothetical protein
MIAISKSDPRLQLRGVRRRGAGWQVYRQVRGALLTRTFPIEATAAELITAWEELAGEAPSVPAEGSLAEALTDYLPTVTAQPTYREKKRSIEIALAVFGSERAATSITANEIARLVNAWRTSAPLVGQHHVPAPRVLAGDTILKRLAHLTRFFDVILPAGAPNPVRLCKERPKPAKATTRGIPMADVARILEAMSDYRANNVRTGRPRELSLAKVRASVTAYTGLDPAQIKQLKPGDLKLDGPDPYFKTGRDKGDGTGIHVVELTAPGVEALRAFVAAKAWGSYDANAVNTCVKRAAARVGIPLGTFRQKDLRHSFLTEIYRISRDVATVARFACHCPGSPVTVRYTRAAHQDVDRATAARFTVPAAPAPARVLRLAGRRR